MSETTGNSSNHTAKAIGSGNGTHSEQQTAASSQPPGDGAMAALGELICRLNPYTRLPPDATTGERTGKMELRYAAGTQARCEISGGGRREP